MAKFQTLALQTYKSFETYGYHQYYVRVTTHLTHSKSGKNRQKGKSFLCYGHQRTYSYTRYRGVVMKKNISRFMQEARNHRMSSNVMHVF